MSHAKSFSVRIHVDGGARGNPGPAGAGIVISTADDGTVLYQAGLFLGIATNNVAEYKGLLAGLRAAAKLGASQVEAFSDSELIVRQLNGQYRVKNAGLRPLYEQVLQLQGQFDRFSIRHVRREQNKEADRLVNQALDLRRNVEDAAD